MYFGKESAFLGFAMLFFLSCADNSDMEFPSKEEVRQRYSSSGIEPSSSSSYRSSSSSSSICTASNNNATYYCSNGTMKQYGSFTYDGKTYKTIEIGTQIWMAQNLNYAADGSQCYNGSEVSCTTYGRLYTFASAKTACPAGWHLPSDVEWGTLMLYINPNCSLTGDCANAGKLLKATNGWDSNGNGTDSYGFSALPGGYRHANEGYDIGKLCRWWTSSPYSTVVSYTRKIHHDNESVIRGSSNNGYLYSVRCLKN